MKIDLLGVHAVDVAIEDKKKSTEGNSKGKEAKKAREAREGEEGWEDRKDREEMGGMGKKAGKRKKKRQEKKEGRERRQGRDMAAAQPNFHLLGQHLHAVGEQVQLIPNLPTLNIDIAHVLQELPACLDFLTAWDVIQALSAAFVLMEGQGEMSNNAECGSVKKFGLGHSDEPKVWEEG